MTKQKSTLLQVFRLKSFSRSMALKRGKITFREAAKEIGGISHMTYYKIEKWGRIPDLETYLRICKWLGVPNSFTKL